MIKALFTAIVFLLLTMYAHAQIVKGIVVNATTGDPIAGASIYLNGSSKGTTSNVRGEFILYTDETKIPLVVSSIGYQSEIINDHNNKVLTVKLSPRAQVLREVVIGGSGMTREEQMKIFLTQFLGTTNAENCYIDNPDEINFRYHKKTKTLEADAIEPLIIVNKKLGYKITYSLSVFSYSRKKKETSYKGDYIFEEDTLGLKPIARENILKARDKAYYGSRMHFIRSVWADDVEKNNFQYAYNNGDNPTHFNFFFNNMIANSQQLLNHTSITTLVNGIHHFLEFPCMVIRYNSGYESHLSFKSGTKDVRITLISYNQSNLIWSGKLAEQRVSELLPYDFEPMEQCSKASKEITSVK